MSKEKYLRKKKGFRSDLDTPQIDLWNSTSSY